MLVEIDVGDAVAPGQHESAVAEEGARRLMRPPVWVFTPVSTRSTVHSRKGSVAVAENVAAAGFDGQVALQRGKSIMYA